MSPKKKKGAAPLSAPEPFPGVESAQLSAANPAVPASLTPAQFQEWSSVLKRIEDSKWVVPAVLAAGVAAVFEVIHLGWLFVKWLYYFLR